MIVVQIDEARAEEIYREEVAKKLEQLSAETVYWDRKDLIKHSKRSWNTIVDTFFHHPDFPKWKEGKKWYFPARQAAEFLEQWQETKRRDSK